MITEFLTSVMSDRLNSLFSREAGYPAAPGNSTDGLDLSDLAANNQTLLALGSALVAGYADGDDGILGAGLKGVFDFAAVHDIADGKSGFLSELYMSYRVGSITSEQTGSTLAGLVAGATAYFAADKWEDRRTAMPKPAFAPAR